MANSLPKFKPTTSTNQRFDPSSPQISMNSSTPSTIHEFLSREVEDWDDDVVSTARFKAFSGHKSDWESKFQFWRDLIFKLARHLRVFAFQPAEVKNVWFIRGGLTPLCIEQVLLEMHIRGDILLRRDLIDSTGGRMYQIFRRVHLMIGKLGSLSLREIPEDTLILKMLLQERATEIINTLAESHWTSTCIITLEKFHSLCSGSDEATIILSHLVECGKAQYLSIRREDFIEGVKLSLMSISLPKLSTFDYDALHLIWTSERLQQQLDVIHGRWEFSRKLALASFKSGNKHTAYRHIRQSKLFSESRVKCTSLLERVEEVLRAIADAESTRQVSATTKIGAQAIKEKLISMEEVHTHLQELDESIAAQKEVKEALESLPLQSMDVEDDEIEEEFMKLEVELADEMPKPQLIQDPASHKEEVKWTQESTESLSQALSNLNLEVEAT